MILRRRTLGLVLDFVVGWAADLTIGLVTVLVTGLTGLAAGLAGLAIRRVARTRLRGARLLASSAICVSMRAVVAVIFSTSSAVS